MPERDAVACASRAALPYQEPKRVIKAASQWVRNSSADRHGQRQPTPSRAESRRRLRRAPRSPAHLAQRPRPVLQPPEPLTDEFKTDCLIWMLFNRCNRTAGANDLAWNGRKWSLVNHFIPFTEAEVGAPDRFESDFMVQYLADKPLLPEAVAVLETGRTLWKTYFAHTDVRTVRDELKLNRPDVGWYQIRNALKARNASGDTASVNFGPFEAAYQVLTDKLRPQVFKLGFLR